MEKAYKRLKKFYESISVTKLSESDKRRLKIMIELVRDLKVKKLLDVGCIPEMTETFVNTLKCEGVGINISKKVLRSARKTKKIKYICADAQYLSLNEKFDLIVCGEILEHLLDVDDFIYRVKKLLNPNGYLLLTIPNLASLFNRISLLFGWQPRGLNPSRKILLNPFTKYDYNWGHVSMFTHYSIKKFLKENGFKILKIRGTYGGHEGEGKLRKFIRWLMSLKTSFAEQLIILAQLTTF
jgi:2-polyprenyl-3-methyl-5-hydroxy-6-metoxy-1,4-benzoquinol methylase